MAKGFVFYCMVLGAALTVFAEVNLLENGDFNLPGDGTAATGWEVWSWGNGWANTEIAEWGSYDGSYHITLGASGSGGGGYYQVLAVSPGTEYTLSVASGAEAWWLPTGTMTLIWLRSDTDDLTDPNNIISEDGRNTVDPEEYGGEYDIEHPWESYSLTATAPSKAFFVKVELAANNATGSVGFDDTLFVLTENSHPPYDPDPADEADDISVTPTLSWHVSDPNGVVNPDLAAHKLYLSDGSDDPNVFYVDTIDDWDETTLRASYTPAALDLDGRYFWRVDMVMNDATELTGPTWQFKTPVSAPTIVSDPAVQTVDAAATAEFSVEVSSVSAETYQWYKAGDPNVALSDGGDISGVTTETLTIANAELADEGYYYCVVVNESDIAVASEQAPLIIKRRLAYWDFESSSADSIVSGSPASVLVGDPVFVTGISGDGMEFDADTDAEDMLYTDLSETDYFDACCYSMTVACWIKSDSTVNWAPLVARNGEENGWQLRQGSAGEEGDDRAVFSTRGLTIDDNDGVPADRTAFDGQWHYVVGTYDGAVKKLYIDGVLSVVYTLLNDGGGVAISYDGEAATGVISASTSAIPVSIAGRYGDDPAGIDDQFTAGVYDEVEIYNYALDAETIAQNYATMTGLTVCPTVLDYDLNGDCQIDLADFGLLASVWLTDINVWP